MTIQSTDRKSPVYAGDGVQTQFPFSFKVFREDELRVIVSAGDVETDLGSGYTVTLSPDQENTPGGEVTLAMPLADGAKLVIASNVANLQPMKLTNQGGFYPRRRPAEPCCGDDFPRLPQIP